MRLEKQERLLEQGKLEEAGIEQKIQPQQIFQLQTVEMRQGLPTMTLSRRDGDASLEEHEENHWREVVRRCRACGGDFRPKRKKQRQCSPRCRQRAYMHRRSDLVFGYYGA